MWIHQDAWFHMGDFDTTTELEYDLHKKGNGVYAFLIEGTAEIAGETLQKRDALGVWDTDGFSLKANPHSRILLIEVPKND